MTVALNTIEEELAKNIAIKSGQDSSYYEKAVAIMTKYIPKDNKLLQKISQC